MRKLINILLISFLVFNLSFSQDEISIAKDFVKLLSKGEY